MSLGLTVAGPCVVDVDTRRVKSKCTTDASANITGAVMSSARPVPRSYRSTDVADCRRPSAAGTG